MKLVCRQSDLNQNLSLVVRAVPTHPTHPVLANVRLVADAEQQYVQLTAFDLSLGIQTRFEAQVEEPGEATLPAKLLGDIVSRLSEGDLTLETEETEADEEASSILATLVSASGRYQMRGMGTEEFPSLPEIEEGQSVRLGGEAPIEGLRGTLFATSSDETKQVLTGVHLKADEEGLEFAATDGHRLAVVRIEKAAETEEVEESEDSEEGEEKTADTSNLITDTYEPFEVTVPARALREVERIAGKLGQDAIVLSIAPGQVVFEIGDRRITSRTLEGQYPAYGQLIPRSFERQVTVDRRQLLSALERIAVLADRQNSVVKFDIDAAEGQVSLSVDAREIGTGRESLSAQISGEDLEIAFNVKYVLDSLKVLQSSEIQIRLNGESMPAILSPLGGLKTTHLVMPVQIRN